jgi:hypothetical protein
MPYIGNDLQVAFPSYTNIDNIGASFNGVLTTFPLNVSGSTPVPFPINPQQCLISVNGVIQKPDATGVSGFNLVGSDIVFASAPTAGWAFFGVVLAGADYINVGAKFPDGAANSPSMTFENGLTTGLYLAGANQLGFTSNSTLRMLFDANGRNVVYSASVGNVRTLTDQATITPDFSLGNNYVLTLGGNRTLANPTNLIAGQSGTIVITQDGTGSRTLNYGGFWKYPGGFGNIPLLTTTAGAVDVLGYYVESTTRITFRLLLNVS